MLELYLYSIGLTDLQLSALEQKICNGLNIKEIAELEGVTHQVIQGRLKVVEKKLKIWRKSAVNVVLEQR